MGLEDLIRHSDDGYNRSHNAWCVVLGTTGYIMTACEFMERTMEECGSRLIDDFEMPDPPDSGFWLFEGRYRWTKHWTDCGYEYEEYMSAGEYRRPTAAELFRLSRGMYLAQEPHRSNRTTSIEPVSTGKTSR
jgi:hypothetical protein